MAISGAVEATKYIRDRSKDIIWRVKLAQSILDDNIDAIIPRKELVILEWVFDMLATDTSAKKSIEVWELLLRAWSSAPETGRLRIYRNHKVIAIIIEALQLNSSQFVDLITRFVKRVSETVQVPSSVSEVQGSQLIIAYLANEHAVSNNDLKDFIFKATKSKPRIFGICDSSILALILNEPDVKIKTHFAIDYLSSSCNSIIPVSRDLLNEDLTLLVEALCEADVSVKQRVFLLLSTFPEKMHPIFSTIHAKRPSYADADLLKHILTITFSSDEIDWSVLSACLRVNAVPLFENEEWLNRILKLETTSDELLGLILVKAAQLRNLSHFILHWTPLKPLSAKLMTEYTKSVESLSPLQVSKIMENLSPSSYELEILIRAITYQTANSDTVKAVLTSLLRTNQLSSSLELHILQLIPDTEFPGNNSKKSLEIALRKAEMDHTFYDDVRPIITNGSCSDDILLRFFPLLDDLFQNASELASIVHGVSTEARLQIACHPRGPECQKIIYAIIDSAIRNSELSVLDSIPKLVFNWDQRHKAVSVALNSSRNFAMSSRILINLIDHENLPPAKELGDFIGQAEMCTSEIDLILRIVFMFRKNIEFTKSVMKRISNDWLKSIIYSQLAQWAPEDFSGKLKKARKWLAQTQGDQNLMTPTLYVLSLLQPTQETKLACQSIVMKDVSQGVPINSSLFQTMCRQDHSWPVMTALFLCAESSSAKHFADYCKTLCASNLDSLIYSAVQERLYRVLMVLAHHRVILVEHAKYQVAITVAVAATYGNGESSVFDFSSYWAFCDALIREYPKMLSQFALEAILESIIRQSHAQIFWEQQALIISRVLFLKRQSLKNRLHLIVAALSGLLHHIDSIFRAQMFVRLIDNLCNPPQPKHRLRDEKQALSSLVARERRHVAKHAGVLMQNIISKILQHVETASKWCQISTELKTAVFLLVDLIYGDGLKAFSAEMDKASRAYLRSVFEDYKLHGRWSSD